MYGLIVRPKNVEPGLVLSLPPVSSAGARKRPLSVPYDETQLRGLLMRFDTNRDGRLSKEELRAAFKSLGSRAPGVRAFFALFRADKNNDGYIDDDEFDVLVKFIMQIGYTVK